MRLKNELIVSIAKYRKKFFLDYLEVNVIEIPQGTSNIEIVLLAFKTEDFDLVYQQYIEPTMLRYGVIHSVNFVDEAYDIGNGSYAIKRKIYINAENHFDYIIRMDELNGTITKLQMPFYTT